MHKRKQELAALNDYVDKVDKETTLLLQNLQWDHKHLLESPAMVSCKYDTRHRVPLHSVEAHEKQCFLNQLGYCKDDILLPDAVESLTGTTVTLGKHDIMQIINTAAASDPTFKRGSGAAEPQSAGRLQVAYSADERRAIHDAVVAAAPSLHCLDDLPLPSGSAGSGQAAGRSREAVLAELRDMKRRRARYRVRSTTAHYSDVLRGLIKAQMELYAEAKGIFIKTEYGTKSYVSLETKAAETEQRSQDIVIKQERLSPDTESHQVRSKRHRERSRSRERKRRTEHDERGTDISRRRHSELTSREESTEKRKYKDYSDDKYSKDRRRYECTDRDKHRKSDRRNMAHDNGSKREESTSSKDSRYEDHRKQSKYTEYSDRSYSEYSKSSRHDSSSKDFDKHRRCKDKSSNDSKYGHKRKYDENEREYKHLSRKEDKHRHRDSYKSEKCEDY